MKLYFTKGPVPSEAEKAEAKSLGIESFRNARRAGMVEEGVDEVAGAIPAQYLNRKKIKVVGEAAKLVPATSKK